MVKPALQGHLAPNLSVLAAGDGGRNGAHTDSRLMGGATGVYRSDNSGNSWSQFGGGLPVTSVRGFASDDQFIVAGTFGGGVFYSKNNGDTWTELNTGLTDQTIFDLVISNGFLVAATNTGGAFRIPLSALK